MLLRQIGFDKPKNRHKEFKPIIVGNLICVNVFCMQRRNYSATTTVSSTPTKGLNMKYIADTPTNM